VAVAARKKGSPAGNGRVLGLMPHPERAMAGQEGGKDGLRMFESLMAAA